MPTCFLIDNGSLRAASTLNLRAIARRLSGEIEQRVEPVSLLHSNKVDPADLSGEPAEILPSALDLRLERGERDFVILPLFFGPSLAITSHLPKRVAALRRDLPGLRVRIAPPLFDKQDGADLRLARILQERVEEVLEGSEMPAVVVVDHGSPAPEVTYVRNFVAGQLSVLLNTRVSRIAAASMERREGEEFKFNEPLLEKILRTNGFNHGKVIVAMMFLSPGRHAGEGGDVEAICRAAEAKFSGLRTVRTRLVGDHPDLIRILAERFRTARAAG